MHTLSNDSLQSGHDLVSETFTQRSCAGSYRVQVAQVKIRHHWVFPEEENNWRNNMQLCDLQY